MRILPIVSFNRSFDNKTKYTQNKLNDNQTLKHPNVKAHQYTGVACADLAYASMFDSAIARDLKLMGLI